MNEKKVAKLRKHNMKLYPIYKMIGLDLLFYYGIKVLFLTQVKGISDAEIVLASSFYAFFSILIQIPVSILIEKIGKRKGVILGNAFNIISVILIIFCPNFAWYVVEEFISSIAFALKGISESPLIDSSIPKVKTKGSILSNLESKGYSRYCYFSAISTLIAGFLYDINPYIPVFLCLACVVCCLIASINFVEISDYEDDDSCEDNEKKSKGFMEYFNNIKDGFKFIFKSQRLKGLLTMIGMIWGLLVLMSTYQVTLLKTLNISAGYIGTITAILAIITGTISRYSDKFNKRYKNKTLTIIALSITIGAVISGLIAATNFLLTTKLIIILSTYVIRSGGKGIYQVIKLRYLSNFMDPDILPKIHSANSIICNLMRMFTGFVGSFILSNMVIEKSFIVVGLLFTGCVLMLSKYMKTRVGLNPRQYDRSEIKVLIEEKWNKSEL